MSFSHTLERLRAASQGWQKGMPQGSCIVKQEDLRELLHHFDRLDQQVRASQESPLRIDHQGRTEEMCRSVAAELERVNALNAELVATLKAINEVIYATGAPLGSEVYFKVRELAVVAIKAEKQNQ